MLKHMMCRSTTHRKRQACRLAVQGELQLPETAIAGSGIDYEAFMALEDLARPYKYTEQETLLYALAIGLGQDPLDPDQLRFVYEGKSFQSIPTLAAVVARSPLPRTLPVNFNKVLHAEQFLTVHAELPTSADLLADTRLTRIVDKGADKGALIYYETCARQRSTGEQVFTVGGSLLARGDGGFGGSGDVARDPHPMPARKPDLVVEIETRTDQALLYRLTGDRNPLHADPVFAKRAGFDRPILHGLCTYALACRAVMSTVCNYKPERIRQFNVRFTSPAYPGDKIVTDIWVDGNEVAFCCRVPQRDVVVLSNGFCQLA